MRVPWTSRRSNQSILKEINSEYSLEELTLKLQYFGYLMGRTSSLEKTEDRRQKKAAWAEDEMVRHHHQLNGHEFEQTLGGSGEQRSLARCRPQGRKELDMT